MDDLVTVYYSQETGEVIGSLIKGVAAFCRRVLQQMPGFKIEIHDGHIRLVHIFLARLWSTNVDPHDMTTLTYKKLIEVAEAANVDAELCLT